MQRPEVLAQIFSYSYAQFYPVLCLCGVHRYSIPGGYSSKAIRPIALAKVMSIAQMMKAEFPGSDFSLSGIGGVETGNDAAEFILLGSNTVQVCTGVMLHGYGHVKSLCKDLQAFMSKHGFTSIEDF
jgi:dihydropyrimidine dehydrogenase (NADP+)